MKIIHDRTRDGKLLRFKMVPETIEEVEEMVVLGKTINRPVKTFGSLGSGGYLWVSIPLRPPRFHDNDFGNEVKP
jgi:hypothetical protein